MANKVLADLRTRQREFRDTVKKNAEANEAAWIAAKAKLEADWKTFEADVTKYVESFSKHIEQQQATFKVQAAAQLNAWREAADKLASDAKEFAAERRTDIDAALKRMNADAAAAEVKLQKLNQAGDRVMVRAYGCSDGNARYLRSRQSGGTGSVQTSSLRKPNRQFGRPPRGSLPFCAQQPFARHARAASRRQYDEVYDSRHLAARRRADLFR
jgi:hypothetical protein